MKKVEFSNSSGIKLILLVIISCNIANAQSVIATGTINYLPKFTAASVIRSSFIFDNGTNVGIGTATPAYKLDVNGSIRG